MVILLRQSLFFFSLRLRPKVLFLWDWHVRMTECKEKERRIKSVWGLSMSYLCFCKNFLFPPIKTGWILLLYVGETNFILWPQIRQDYPLNLSILISGGKETNKDSLSNGEWSGNSSNLKSPGATLANCSLEKRFLGQDTVQVLWNETSERVRIPYLAVSFLFLYGAFSKSRVVWECSPKWVVNFI